MLIGQKRRASQQPQSAQNLDRTSPFNVGLLALIAGNSNVNLASGKALTVVGTPAQATTIGGVAKYFAFNGYVETETHAAIGTGDYVEYWVGVPTGIDYTNGSTTDSGFVTGSASNAIGICQQNRSGGAGWCAVTTWPTMIQTVPPVAGQLSVIVSWRASGTQYLAINGVIGTSGANSTNIAATTLLTGAFIENSSFWYSNIRTLLAGRVAATWSAAMVAQFSANPWQIFSNPSINVGAIYSSSTGSVALAGNAVSTASASGSMAEAAPLSGAAVGVATASGALLTAMPLSGAAAAVAQASGNLLLGVALSGSAIAHAVASGALSVSAGMAGAANVTGGASGAISTADAIAGAAAIAASATGTMQIQVSIAGAAIVQTQAAGNLLSAGSGALSGNAQVTASAAGALSVAVPLAGNAQVHAAANGNMGAGTALQGAAVVVTAAGGVLNVTVSMTGAALAQAIAAGGMSIQVPISGNAALIANAAGALSSSATPLFIMGNARGCRINARPRFSAVDSRIRVARIGARSRVARVKG